MFGERFGGKKKVLGMVAAAGLAAGEVHAQTPDLHEEHIEGAAATIGNLDLDVFVPLVRPAGEVDWTHIGRLLEPAYLDVSRERSRPEMVSFTVPYEYARFFDTGNPLSPEDYEAAKTWMAGEVKQDLANSLHGFAWDKKHFTERTGFQEGQGLVVDQITIVGMTSPEAHGAVSIEPGMYDDANTELGEHRANDALDRLLEVLNAQGIDVSEAVPTIASEELQFSEEEMSQLRALAQAQGLSNDTDGVYQLISRYNFDRINDAVLQAKLDEIVGSKRKVDIEITFKEGEKDHVLIPLPLLALLLLRRRGKENQQPDARAGRGGQKGLSDSSVRPEGVDSTDGIKKGDVKRPEIWKTVPEEMKDPRQYAVDVEADITHSFMYYQPFADEAIARGQWDLNEMTHDILEAWNATDNARRRQMGQPEEDHKKRPRQVFYAYMHAVALRELAKAAQEKGPHTPLSIAWKESEVRSRVAAAIIKEAEYLAKIHTTKIAE